VFDRAEERAQAIEPSFYQRQYDVVKEKFDRWHQRTYEKEAMIKNYMALNHYKMTLLFKAFEKVKQVPILNKKSENFRNSVLDQV